MLSNGHTIDTFAVGTLPRNFIRAASAETGTMIVKRPMQPQDPPLANDGTHKNRDRSSLETDRIESIAVELGELARATGTERFYESLMAVYGRLATHGIITVVRYNRFSKPDFLFHRDFSDELVRAYLDGFYELDPFYHYWLANEQPGIIALHELPAGALKRRQYTSKILRHSHIRDELAMFLPPIARSSVAVVLERTDGSFRPGEIERIRRLYPILAGIHDAHVKCTFAGIGSNESRLDLNAGIPAAIVDASGDRVSTNEDWRALEDGDPELRRALATLDSNEQSHVDISGQRTLHRTALGTDFPLAPGGWLYRMESREETSPLAPPRQVFALRYPALSPRELDIVELILQGYSNQGIAERLTLSRGTIKNYRRRLYDKVGISSERALFLMHIRMAFGEDSTG